MNKADHSDFFRIDLAVNLTMMLGTGGFFFFFPALFAPWPPRFVVDAVLLAAVGQAAGLAAAIWARMQGARFGPLGRRILAGAFGAFLAAIALILLSHLVLVLFFFDPAQPSSDFLLMRMLPFGAPALSIAAVFVVRVYDQRQVR